MAAAHKATQQASTAPIGVELSGLQSRPWASFCVASALCNLCNAPPQKKSAKKSQQISGTNRQTNFSQSQSWISVPGPKHTFLSVAL